MKIENNSRQNSVNSNKSFNQENNFVSNSNKKTYIVVFYTQGLSVRFKTACGKHGIHVYFKGGKTTKNLKAALKGIDPIIKSGTIYRYRYDKVHSDEEYTGKSSRTLG